MVCLTRAQLSVRISGWNLRHVHDAEAGARFRLLEIAVREPHPVVAVSAAIAVGITESQEISSGPVKIEIWGYSESQTPGDRTATGASRPTAFYPVLQLKHATLGWVRAIRLRRSPRPGHHFRIQAVRLRQRGSAQEQQTGNRDQRFQNAANSRESLCLHERRFLWHIDDPHRTGDVEFQQQLTGQLVHAGHHRAGGAVKRFRGRL